MIHGVMGWPGGGDPVGVQPSGLIPVKPASIAYAGTAASISGNTVSFTAVSSISVNGCFTNLYDNYVIAFRVTGSSNQGLRIRMRIAGSDDATSNYGYQYVIAASSSVTAAQSTSQTSIRFGQVNTSPWQFGLTLYQPARAGATGVDALSSYMASAVTIERWAGAHNVATAYDGFTLFPDSGTITSNGSLRVYALAN